MSKVEASDGESGGSVVDFASAAEQAKVTRASWEEQCANVLISYGVLDEDAYERAIELRARNGMSSDPVAVARRTMSHSDECDEGLGSL